MDAPASQTPPPPILQQLRNHLRATGSTLTPEQATTLAISDWIAARAAGAPAGATHGYRWKCLFLPDGTELRMRHGGETYHARVAGDAIVFRGRSVSPRQLTLAIAGDGRNAWRDLTLKMPGERHWKRASVLRREVLEADAPPPPPSPLEIMDAAAASMAAALKSALQLVEHVNARAAPPPERRVDRHRRTDDFLADACALD